MIDVEHVVFEELGPEFKEFLRATMPNLGFFTLCDTMVQKINQDLANLNTTCSDAEFRQKYNNLLLERTFYEGLKRVAERFNENTIEES